MKKGCSSIQLTLAWILAQGDDFFIISGTIKIKNLEDNVGAAQVKLGLRKKYKKFTNFLRKRM